MLVTLNLFLVGNDESQQHRHSFLLLIGGDESQWHWRLVSVLIGGRGETCCSQHSFACRMPNLTASAILKCLPLAPAAPVAFEDRKPTSISGLVGVPPEVLPGICSRYCCSVNLPRFGSWVERYRLSGRRCSSKPGTPP